MSHLNGSSEAWRNVAFSKLARCVEEAIGGIEVSQPRLMRLRKQLLRENQLAKRLFSREGGYFASGDVHSCSVFRVESSQRACDGTGWWSWTLLQSRLSRSIVDGAVSLALGFVEE